MVTSTIKAFNQSTFQLTANEEILYAYLAEISKFIDLLETK